MVRVNLNEGTINQIQNQIKENVSFMVMQDIRIDVDSRQVVPFLTGTLDDSAHTFDAIRKKGKRWELHYSAPYAIRRYYDPYCNFTTQYHANAGDHWLECYKTGASKFEWVVEDAQQRFNQEIWRNLM